MLCSRFEVGGCGVWDGIDPWSGEKGSTFSRGGLAVMALGTGPMELTESTKEATGTLEGAREEQKRASFACVNAMDCARSAGRFGSCARDNSAGSTFTRMALEDDVKSVVGKQHCLLESNPLKWEKFENSSYNAFYAVSKSITVFLEAALFNDLLMTSV
ncbi:hypothetical protein NDU88_001131 [Pleurodeles waltl]|uniref:Uncharacterized protein n=1 Tax=Pleurodeles waltl TaxID=8319 RepID=A0AAV7U608_PLEWA|nr:hypothetical protein NDU88_001131 [Pleurodeles waltl]